MKKKKKKRGGRKDVLHCYGVRDGDEGGDEEKRRD